MQLVIACLVLSMAVYLSVRSIYGIIIMFASKDDRYVQGILRSDWLVKEALAGTFRVTIAVALFIVAYHNL